MLTSSPKTGKDFYLHIKQESVFCAQRHVPHVYSQSKQNLPPRILESATLLVWEALPLDFPKADSLTFIA